MLEYDFEESVGYWVYMTSRAIEQAMNEELVPHGITYRQCQVLFWLAHEGDLSQTQLAERMRIEAPTLVGILDRMEEKGWLRRLPSATDRRKKMIQPTRRVKPIWKKITTCARKVRARIGQGIPDAEIQIVKDVLARMQNNLQSQEKFKESVA